MSTRLQSRRSNLSLAAVSRKAHAQSQNAPGAGVAESPVKMEEADEPANGRARRAVAKAAAYAEVDSDQDVGTDSDSAFEISARPAPGKRAKPGKGHGVESGEEVDLDVELDGDGDGDGNDDQCTACLLEDGTLLCCDGCPRAYHLDCLPRSMQVEVLQAPDDAEWKCPLCIGYSDSSQPDASDDDFEAPLPRTKPATDKGKGKAPMRDAEASVTANQKAAPSDGNDDLCQTCGSYGRLVCCDGCVRAYHPDCLPPAWKAELCALDDDDQWLCMFCRDAPTGGDNEMGGGAKGKEPMANEDEMETSNQGAGPMPSATSSASKNESRVKGPRSALTSFLEEKGINARKIRDSYFQRNRGTRRPKTPGDESSDVDVDVENDSANEGAPARSRRRPRGSDDEGGGGGGAYRRRGSAKKPKRKPRGGSDDSDDVTGSEDDGPLLLCMACARPLSRRLTMADVDPAHPLCQLCKAAKEKKARAASRARTKKVVKGAVLEELHKEIPPLQAICIKFLVDHIEDVESFGYIAPDALAEICRIVCRNRKLTPDILPLFVESGPRRLDLTDCANLDKESFKQIGWACPDLTHLRLEECGKLTDEELTVIAANCTGLKSVVLHGCYLVTEAGLETLITANPGLETFDVAWNPYVGETTVRCLADHCPNLRALALAQCSGLNDEALPHLAAMPKLAELTISASPITDEGLIGALPAIADRKQLVKLDVAECEGLTSEAVQCVANRLPGLETLSIEGLRTVTDETFAAVVSSCPRLTHVNIRNCALIGPETVTALLKARGPSLSALSLAGLEELGRDVFLTLVAECHWRMETLDVSWCRSVDDEIVEAILANFRHLKALHIWGCHRVTEFSYRKAPRHVKVFGGMHI